MKIREINLFELAKARNNPARCAIKVLFAKSVQQSSTPRVKKTKK